MAEELELIRLSTAGSVDDGKSTLLGQLLLASGGVHEDLVESLLRDSTHRGEAGINLAHITDGLRAEREQNITIDVAYRYLTTARRRFIIADTPGHHQYTRNMVTGASTADAALILVDVRNGVTEQTRRHLFICSVLRIPQVALVVNKMDLVGYAEPDFAELRDQVRDETARLQLPPLTYIPTSAVSGENVTTGSTAMDWYSGPSVLEYMDGLSGSRWLSPPDLRIPVQYVIRPNMSFRGYAAQVASGSVRVGDELVALPGNHTAVVRELSDTDGPCQEALAGANVVIQLDREIDLSRGQMLARPRNLPTVTTSFEAVLCWMSTESAIVGKPLSVRQTTREVAGRITEIVYRFNIGTFHRESAAALRLNDIGRVVIECGQPLMLDTYEHNRATGSFILVDPVSNDVVAAGVVSRPTRAEQGDSGLGGGRVVWFLGLSGAGKSTLADAVANRLRLAGVPVARLDGDDLRGGLNADLGFSPKDRHENLRRAAHVALLFARLGNVTLCSFITPTESDRAQVREIVGEGYAEVYVKASLDACEARDPKGHYRRARAGELPNFTGIDAPFDLPGSPDLVVDTEALSLTEAVELIVSQIRDDGLGAHPDVE